MIEFARRRMRRYLPWIRFQELRREGFVAAWRHHKLQVPILQTPPVRTAASGAVEVRVLTWRRDWINLIWAVKTYYHFAGVDYPLVIHDGGLLARQVEALRGHFPDARFIPITEADVRFPSELRRRGLPRSAEYRAKNVTTRKLFDFFLDSTADYVISIDSDIVFFRRPELLIVPPRGLGVNRYNEDHGFWYSMSIEELKAAFGIAPPPGVNSGLSVVRRESIDFPAIEQFLENPVLFGDAWVTEQTLHALLSARYGLELLPPTYRIGGSPGLAPDIVCKHYPGAPRPLLYNEGMRQLLDSGLITVLKSRRVDQVPCTY
jgi:hypothetical protein